MTYEYVVFGEEVWFHPIEAQNIHQAARKVREIVSDKTVWSAGVEPFSATVEIKAVNGEATVRMTVECATR